MFTPLINKLKENHTFQYLISCINKGERLLRLNGINRGAKSFFISAVFSAIDKNIVVLSSDEHELEALKSDFEFFFPFHLSEDHQLIQIPSLGMEPYQPFSPHLETQQQRMQSLWRLMKGGRFIALTSIEAFMLPVINLQMLTKHTLSVKVGANLPYRQLFEFLHSIGYKREDMVEEAGDYAVRGGIVDLFSPQNEYPYRMEYLGDTIESLRTFDPVTQRSQKELKELNIVPLGEVIISKKDIPHWMGLLKERWPEEIYKKEIAKKIEELKEKSTLPDVYYLAPLKKGSMGYLIDYFSDVLFVFDEPALIDQAIERLEHQFLIRYRELTDKGKIALNPGEIIMSKDSLYRSVTKTGRVDLHELPQKEDFGTGVTISINCRSLLNFKGKIPQFIKELKSMLQRGDLIILQMSTLGQSKRLAGILQEYNLTATLLESDLLEFSHINDVSSSSNCIIITTGKARDSFYLPEEKIIFITEESIFGPKTSHRQLRKGRISSFIDQFRDVKEGDFVVHIDHGIGIYKGINQLAIEGKVEDFLEVEYKDHDKLYLPIDSLNQINKYSSSEGITPPLNKLGGTSWAKVKKKVKKGVRDLTRELISLYAARMAIKGHAFSFDTPWQKEFEASFEYTETPDQVEAIRDVKKDMESDKPMDRLLCGDVGYGKTEIALRAAFKAVMDGNQVAMLAPTTVLALQHFRTFKERFRSFPVEIEMLSRFRSKKEQKEIIARLKKGAIDVIIGTHRLISSDVSLSRLGLLIIDEEQRFGVSHKEKIKQLRRQVDVLTMTATPIPRTLNMAISGVRDLSLIQTPPENRFSIQTHLIKFDTDIIRSAILQELKRTGQVYFVHNRIENIDSIAALIKRICPEARLGITHGRMPEKRLEKEMLNFINRQYDILLTTAIIENGLDIASVNTIIINRADRFGLAQLYQLRGRVGRSQQRAYAYLIVPPESSLGREARERLKAIREFTELGSGFRLAAWDLEIRGAGNLLGAEQHGHIAAVGFDMYCRMLEETAKELKGEPLEEEFKTTINLGLDIYIPEAYIPDSNIKLMLYRQLSSIKKDVEVEAFETELRDRYGRLPPSVENLLSYLRLKLLAEKLSIKRIDRKGNMLSVQFSQDSDISADELVKLVAHRKAHFSSEGILVMEVNPEASSLTASIEKILQELL
jgi:transcription-repair coupling factor (superfamily II helicase)